MDLLPNEILTVCQLFGFLPIKYKEKSKMSKCIEFSFKFFIWGLTLIATHNITSIIALTFDYLGKTQGNPVRMVSNTAMIAVFLDVLTLNLLGSVFFFSATKKYQNLVEVYCNLNRFDSTLQHEFKKVNVKPKIFITYVMLTVLFYFTIYFYSQQLNNFFVYIPLYMVFYLQAAQFIHFTYTCQILTERFLVINDKIKQAVIRQSFGQLLKDLDDHCPLSDSMTMTASAGVSSVAKIRSLTDLYWILCEAVYQANAFYCCQLLVVVISAFIHITMTLYYLFAQMWPSMQSEKVPHLIMRLIWVIAHSSHLVLTLLASTAVTNAADEAAPMVCKLINRKLDMDLRKYLEVFLIQLEHHNVRFSALGFFNVHSHILTSLAGSVTTYLVILIQFQTQTQINQPQTQACPACNCSTNNTFM